MPHDLGRQALATELKLLGISGPHISGILSGKRGLSLDMAVKIESKIGIPARAWVDGDPSLEMWRIILERENNGRTEKVGGE